jgi:Cellulase (glycosyl hydrolase family 5)
LVIAMIIPISTNTTIATCIQIQVGDMTATAYSGACLPVRQSSRRGTSDLRLSCGDMAGRLLKPAGRLQRSLSTLLALGLCAAAWLVPTAIAGERLPGSHAASLAPLDGVNIVGLYPGVPPARADREIAAAHKLHAKVVRAELPWSLLEPRSPNAIDPRALAFTDRLIDDAAADGIRVIVFVDSTPCWASSAPRSLLRKCAPQQFTSANAWPPNNPAYYAAFVAYLAKRYGTHLAAIEVWNEPDEASQHYFAGPNKAQRYAAILRAAYPAIKQANPNVPVLAGSLVGYNGIFLRTLYAAGIKGYYDGLAVHFYTLTLASLRSIHQVQLANGDTKPLWLDEFGWSSCWPKRSVQEEQACVTSQVQGLNLANTIRLLTRTPWIAALVTYQLQDTGNTSFGVLTTRGTRKASFAALSGVLASPFGLPSPVTLNLRRQGSQVVASGSGPVGDYMQLEVFRSGVPSYRALFTLNRFNQYAIALPSALGTSGLTVRVYQEWTGPARAAQKGI